MAKEKSYWFIIADCDVLAAFYEFIILTNLPALIARNPAPEVLVIDLPPETSLNLM